jgi:hypothetical protein
MRNVSTEVGVLGADELGILKTLISPAANASTSSSHDIVHGRSTSFVPSQGTLFILF